MRRAGSKKRPFFRIVVTEHSSPRDGRFVEIIGHYKATTNPETLVIDGERYAHWVKNGAMPSDTLRTRVDRNPGALLAPSAEAGAAGTVSAGGEATA
jgi:small subunit ribosomal protein S16